LRIGDFVLTDGDLARCSTSLLISRAKYLICQTSVSVLYSEYAEY
jgi:hypothetical protein